MFSVGRTTPLPGHEGSECLLCAVRHLSSALVLEPVKFLQPDMPLSALGSSVIRRRSANVVSGLSTSEHPPPTSPVDGGLAEGTGVSPKVSAPSSRVDYSPDVAEEIGFRACSRCVEATQWSGSHELRGCS